MNIRDYNRKINSLRNTRKITSSMKMISMVKMQRYSKVSQASRPWWETVDAVMKRSWSLGRTSESLLYRGHRSVQSNLIILCSSNRGLCGHYNANVIRTAMDLYVKLCDSGQHCALSFAGTHGHHFFKRRKAAIEHLYETAASKPDMVAAAAISNDCIQAFSSAAYQRVWLVYTRRLSSVAYEPFARLLLPLHEYYGNAMTEADKAQQSNYLLEENRKTLVDRIAGLLVKASIHRALLESSLSEHSARMSAMDSATTSCDRMIRHFIQSRNRARQATITTELSEIITGKEALEH